MYTFHINYLHIFIYMKFLFLFAYWFIPLRGEKAQLRYHKQAMKFKISAGTTTCFGRAASKRRLQCVGRLVATGCDLSGGWWQQAALCREAGGNRLRCVGRLVATGSAVSGGWWQQAAMCREAGGNRLRCVWRLVATGCDVSGGWWQQAAMCREPGGNRLRCVWKLVATGCAVSGDWWQQAALCLEAGGNRLRCVWKLVVKTIYGRRCGPSASRCLHRYFCTACTEAPVLTACSVCRMYCQQWRACTAWPALHHWTAFHASHSAACCAHTTCTASAQRHDIELFLIHISNWYLSDVN